MKKIMSMIMAAMVFLTIGTGYVQAQDKTSDSASELPKVCLLYTSTSSSTGPRSVALKSTYILP